MASSALDRTALSMTNYLSDAMSKISARQKILRKSSPDQQAKLVDAGMAHYLDQLMNCIEANQSVFNDLLSYSEISVDVGAGDNKKRTRAYDHLRVQELLRQIAREWTAEGATERDQSFKPLVDELKTIYPDVQSRKDVRVLIPGAGLARLPFDIALEGFNAVANESSCYMLLMADFIINGCERRDNYRFYPWAHDLNNVLQPGDVLHPLAFPDVTPQSELSNLEVIQGDFLTVCNKRNMPKQVDAVVTSFFLDCTSSDNVLDVVQTVYDALSPGGFWLNLGPLNFVNTFSREGESGSKPLQLSWEQLRDFMESVGFVVESEEQVDGCRYGQNPKSMMQTSYGCVMFRLKK